MKNHINNSNQLKNLGDKIESYMATDNPNLNLLKVIILSLSFIAIFLWVLSIWEEHSKEEVRQKAYEVCSGLTKDQNDIDICKARVYDKFWVEENTAPYPN